jgi:hypothetical protein
MIETECKQPAELGGAGMQIDTTYRVSAIRCQNETGNADPAKRMSNGPRWE